MYAKPRMGKTTCAVAIKFLLNAEFSNKYVEILSADTTKKSTLCRDLAAELGLHFSLRANVASVVDLLITHIICELDELGGDHFVLIIDEMQALQEPAYNELLLLQNRLGIRGIKLTTVGFSQPEINNERTALMVAGATNLIERFLSEPIVFKGCDGVKWLSKVLRSYDEDLQFPEGECTYTEFFFPEAFGAGMRLVQSSELIWETVREVAGKAGSKNLQVEQVFRVIQELLVSMRSRDCAGFRIEKKDIAGVLDKLSLADTLA
ncbi:ATP-binding protein [Ectopseudomonas oleovorans]|jgi:hypothetical protein|nr:ATP-binding protein [Pseudomonas indoloxydans]